MVLGAEKTPTVTFYFDLGSPYAYLAAERLDSLIPGEVQWQPVLLGALFKLGAELSTPARVFEAARQAGLDGIETQRAIVDPEVKAALREATDEAYRIGVSGVPTIAIGDELFWGDDRLEEAASRLNRLTAG